MAVKVSFMRPGHMGPIEIAIGQCRVCETITVPGTTTNVALDREIVVMVSNETNVVVAAHGLTPDAAATVETDQTTAGYGVPSGVHFPVALKTGNKVNIKAFV